jgi:hypothetical protein
MTVAKLGSNRSHDRGERQLLDPSRTRSRRRIALRHLSLKIQRHIALKITQRPAIVDVHVPTRVRQLELLDGDR